MQSNTDVATPARPPANWATRALLTIARAGAAISGGLLVLLAFAVFVDVARRWIFNSPIPGVFEAATLTLVAATFLSLSWVQFQGRQIHLDLVVGRLTGRAANAMAIIRNITALVFFGLLFLNALDAFLSAWHIGDVRHGLIQIPTTLFIGPLALGTALICLASFVAILGGMQSLLRHRPTESVDRS